MEPHFASPRCDGERSTFAACHPYENALALLRHPLAAWYPLRGEHRRGGFEGGTLSSHVLRVGIRPSFAEASDGITVTTGSTLCVKRRLNDVVGYHGFLTFSMRLKMTK
jgi:hypothetical protein